MTRPIPESWLIDEFAPADTRPVRGTERDSVPVLPDAASAGRERPLPSFCPVCIHEFDTDGICPCCGGGRG